MALARTVNKNKHFLCLSNIVVPSCIYKSTTPDKTVETIPSIFLNPLPTPYSKASLLFLLK